MTRRAAPYLLAAAVACNMGGVRTIPGERAVLRVAVA